MESAVNEIKRFTADASHELRNPVSFVRTTAQVALRNREADPASRQFQPDRARGRGIPDGIVQQDPQQALTGLHSRPALWHDGRCRNRSSISGHVRWLGAYPSD
jgi:signal transduction histidine kinase